MATSAAFIDLDEGAAPATPAAGKVRVYAKTDGLPYSKDDAGAETPMGGAGGSVATDAIWDAAGDLAVGTGANTAARLAIGATDGMVLQRVGGAVVWAFPAGFQRDFATFNANVSPNATTEGTANTVVTGNAVTYEAVPYNVHFHANNCRADTTSGRTMTLWLYVDGSSVGPITIFGSAGVASTPTDVFTQYTPSAGSHTLSIRASVSAGTGLIVAGAGGAGVAASLGYIRVTKA